MATSVSSAADLLRQAIMHPNQGAATARLHDDEHDSLSAASTPTGANTPRPDLSDTRLPSILSSYFGQVRASFPQSTSRKSLSSPPAPRPDTDDKTPGRLSLGAGALPTAPNSPAYSDMETPPPLPHERHLELSNKDLYLQKPQHGYPTPPMSSSSSVVRLPSKRNSNSAEDSNSGNTSPGARSPPRSPPAQPVADRIRRRTLALNDPLPNVVTTPTVHAAHISTPDIQNLLENPASPPLVALSSNSHSAELEPERLTQDVALPRDQNTPPRTPRALSDDEPASRDVSPSNKLSSTQLRKNLTKTRSNGTDDAVLGDPKGKLSIIITEGRGLRPSAEPYCVCTFQYNEYISKGPRKDGDKAMSDDGEAGVAMRRTDSESGRPMAIPMRSRQSSHTGLTSRDAGKNREVTDPVWDHEAVFDVVGENAEVDISVYDHSFQEAFLGHVRFSAALVEEERSVDRWFKLEPREGLEETVTGEIHLKIHFQHVEKKHYGPEDFQILKLIGKGTFGQVFQVRKRDTQRVYAMKVLSKKVIVQKKEVAHTLGERNILVRTAMTESPFIVGLKFSFQTPTDLYLVTDYMSGGELFWHLQKEGRFQEERARFYIAELILALQHLHQHDIVYRDLKPENILLDANGHIALCDFGLSKANLTKDDTTNTFCGTTEYLAPEVLLDEQGYTKMVDFWSLGVLVFEMCCGWSPFYADDTQQMYKNIAFGKVRFPRDALSTEGRNFVKGLLNRNPKHRLGATHDAEELKAHPFFADIDWVALSKKNLVPPFKPRLTSETDTSNFDPEFTNALNGSKSSLNARAAVLASGIDTAATPISPTMQAKFKGFTFVDESSLDRQFDNDDDDENTMDQEDDPANWEPASRQSTREGRMSGVQKTGGGGEEGIFNSEGFDV